jgi:hypothetical protein
VKNQQINPLAMTLEEAAKLLSLPIDQVRRHVERGLPTGPDGRISLVQYAAWLNKEAARAD